MSPHRRKQRARHTTSNVVDTWRSRMRGERATRLVVAATASLLVTSSSAFANGRFPRAERLLEHRGDPNRLLVAGTYGILSTRDRGLSWYHVCEASFSRQDAYQGDPLLEWTASDTLLVGVQQSLNLSRDDGCQWDPVLGSESTFVTDYALARSDPHTIFALAADYGGGTVSYSLRRSMDDGATWTASGSALPADLVYTIDVDPGDASHVVASGLAQDKGVLLASTDAGATWTSHPIPNTDSSQAPYIAGLHPFDANRIFVRTDSWVTIDGALTANDALLYSADGGVTWSELFRSRAKLYGFALSSDGGTLLIGYGDPQEGAGQVVSGPFGVFASRTDAFAFAPVLSAHVGCLAWTASGVYVCGSQALDGFELAFAPSGDLGVDGGNLTPLLSLNRVRGPLCCAPSTSGAVCASAWTFSCATFGACGDAGPPVCSADDAGTADDASTADDAKADAALAAPSSSGCGCRVAHRERRGILTWVFAIGIALFRRRRRRF